MKSGLRRLQISRFRLSQYGHSPQDCELHLTLPERLGAGRRRRIGRSRRSPEPVGEAKNDVVRPYIGIGWQVRPVSRIPPNPWAGPTPKVTKNDSVVTADSRAATRPSRKRRGLPHKRRFPGDVYSGESFFNARSLLSSSAQTSSWADVTGSGGGFCV